MPGVVSHEASFFHQRHGVALQPVTRRITAGGKARGHNTGARRKHRAIGRELFGLLRKRGEVGRCFRRNQIASQAIEINENCAAHG